MGLCKHEGVSLGGWCGDCGETVRERRARGRPRTLGASVAINAQLPAELYAMLAGEAMATDKSMSEIVRDALVEWAVAHAVSRRSIAGRKRP